MQPTLSFELKDQNFSWDPSELAFHDMSSICWIFMDIHSNWATNKTLIPSLSYYLVQWGISKRKTLDSPNKWEVVKIKMIPLKGSPHNQHALQGTNISPQNGILKMIFLLPRWDMLIPWRVISNQQFFLVAWIVWGSNKPSHQTLGLQLWELQGCVALPEGNRPPRCYNDIFRASLFPNDSNENTYKNLEWYQTQYHRNIYIL